MRPRLVPTLALCSLACGLLLCGLWALSWWRVGIVEYVMPGPQSLTVAHARGCATFSWRTGGTHYSSNGFHAVTLDATRLGRTPTLWSAVGGFKMSRVNVPTSSRVTLVLTPTWPAVVLLLIPPGVWWRRRRRTFARGFPVEVKADA